MARTGASIVRPLLTADVKRMTNRFLVIAFALVVSACATARAPDPAPEVVAPETPPAPVYLLSDILGTTPEEVETLLGAPALVRAEGAGEFRRYALNECSLIIILYPNDNGDTRTAHVEATALSSGEEKPDLDACLAAG